MSEMQENPVNQDKAQARSSFFKKIARSVRSLGSQIEQEVSELAEDDFDVNNESPALAPQSREKGRSLQLFFAGSFVGAALILGITTYMESDTEDQVSQLIQERASEEQTLTPIASVPLPLESQKVLQTALNNEEQEPAQTEEVSQNEEIVPEHLEIFNVKPKESLANTLKRAGLTNQESYKISTALADVADLKKIQIGDKIEIGKTAAASGEKILFMVTLEDRRGYRYTAIRNDEDIFEANLTEPKVDLKMEYAEGTIDGAFMSNAKNSGIPTNVIHQILWAFDGPVDFRRDLQKGDSYTAVFNKEYNMEGNPTGNGELLYASLNIRKKNFERYFYSDTNKQSDYYDETGKIARKLFTLHPLKAPRQTSSFGMRRHPILGYTTMHWGADFGAPIGTPIRAPGEGTVTKAGRNGSYGHLVQLRHNSEYSSIYAHMSKVDSKISVGKKVKAGEVIGYVGNTGRSTGPHLHWELVKNGKKINPVTQKITAQKKLTGKELNRFMAARDKIRTGLLNNTALAKAEALPEDRKLAYQEPEKPKKIRKTKRSQVQRTASRKTTGANS